MNELNHSFGIAGFCYHNISQKTIIRQTGIGCTFVPLFMEAIFYGIFYGIWKQSRLPKPKR